LSLEFVDRPDFNAVREYFNQLTNLRVVRSNDKNVLDAQGPRLAISIGPGQIEKGSQCLSSPVGLFRRQRTVTGMSDWQVA